MFQFGSAATAPEFVPDADSRDWLAEGLASLSARLGPAAQRPQLLTDPADVGVRNTPRDLDGLFDMICAVQEVVGQEDVELTLLEIDGRAPDLPKEYTSIGAANGKPLHTLHRAGEYLFVFAPAVFKVRELLLGSIARELGRVALHRSGDLEQIEDLEAESELAAITLGMGVWVANGAYIFEQACCGGGCGVDLRNIRTGLSLPEACYALALDAKRKGLRRRSVIKHLEPTQKAAARKSWGHIGSAPPAALAAAAEAKALR